MGVTVEGVRLRGCRRVNIDFFGRICERLRESEVEVWREIGDGWKGGEGRGVADGL